jgi:hypothetical protein
MSMNTFSRAFRTTLRNFSLVVVFFAAVPAGAQGVFIGLPRDDVIEFVNDITKRRVLLVSLAEIEAVEKGAAGPGWRRSEFAFSVYRGSGLGLPGVCRFYAPSVNSHFFTLNEEECAQLRAPGSAWIHEGIAFFAAPPIRGGCNYPPNLLGYHTPIYRLYNNRAAFLDSTHRFTDDVEVRQALVDRGWIDEGVAFCTGTATPKFPRYEIAANQVLQSQECENESLRLGSCVGLNQTVGLPFRLPSSSQSGSIGGAALATQTPYYLTHADGDVVTSVQSAFVGDVTQHSFVVLDPTSRINGFYVNARDRTTGPELPYMSINPLYQFVTTPPNQNESDRRVMPWRDSIVRVLELSFYLDVAHVRRADAGSHAISHPTLELIDTRSRRNLYITLAGAQTVPLAKDEAGDYFAADVGSGKVIVSTSFRSKPSFGQRISGESFYCDADATSHQCATSGGGSFAFRLRPADIAYVIAKARKLDPALSPNIADYAIDNFSFNNEAFNNAELGVRLDRYALTIREQQY